MAEALVRSGSIHRALVVTGCDGLDEVTLDGSTHVRIVESSTIREATWTAADFGLPRVSAPQLVVTGPEESAQRLTQTFAGELGPVRDIVLANAAAALWTIAPCPLPQAVARAAVAIDSGAAARLVERWSKLTGGRP
jgi:anthranilate phosphoribosyltransferase